MPNPDGSQTFEEFRNEWICVIDKYGITIDEIEIKYAYQEYLAILTGEQDKIDKAIATAGYYLWQRDNWRLS